MTTGDTVFLAFATPSSSDLKPFSNVTRAVVIDGENSVLRLASGQVLVHEPRWSSMTVHDTEAEAWEACAVRLDAAAATIEAESSRCSAKAAEAAAASRIVQVPA